MVLPAEVLPYEYDRLRILYCYIAYIYSKTPLSVFVCSSSERSARTFSSTGSLTRQDVSSPSLIRWHQLLGLRYILLDLLGLPLALTKNSRLL